MAEVHPIPTDARFNFQNLTGNQYGHYKVVSYAGKGRFGYSIWNCVCQVCGNEKAIGSGQLKRRSTGKCDKACRCWKPKGQRDTPEYQAWKSMKDRCTNPDHRSFPRYGGRGIKVCNAWTISFAAFRSHVGLRPSPKHSLDRFPNPNGDYEPGNVRWATASEQARNRTNNRVLVHDGKSMLLVEWAKVTGIRRDTIMARLKRGWTVADALTTQV